MRAGSLRHRVTIQQATESQNGFGEPIKSWSNLATVWAAVEPLQGQEFLDGRQLEAAVDTRIRIRHRSGVTQRMRATWGSHVYDVQSVIVDATNRRQMLLMCREVVA